MPLGVPYSEETRRARHKAIYGPGAELPERQLLGPKGETPEEVIYDVLPTVPGEFPELGPLALLPMPRGIARQLAGAGRKV